MKKTMGWILGAGVVLAGIGWFYYYMNSAFPIERPEVRMQETMQPAEPTPRVWGMYSPNLKPNAHLHSASLLAAPPSKLQALFPHQTIDVYTVDIDQDQKTDYVVQRDREACFIDSSFKKRSCRAVVKEQDLLSYRWFTKVDGKIYLFWMDEAEDYSEYFLYRLDPKTWNIKGTCQLNILADSGSGIGNTSPGKVEDLELHSSIKGIRFRAIMDSNDLTTLQDMLTGPYPALFFTGESTYQDFFKQANGKTTNVSMAEFFTACQYNIAQ